MDHTSSKQLTKGITLEPSVKLYFQLFRETVYTHTHAQQTHKMEINMIWHSMKHLFNNRGFVCVTETPTGLALLGVLEKGRSD